MAEITMQRYETPYARSLRERRLTDPSRDSAPYRARGYAVVVISAVVEVGIVRAIGYGWGPFTLSRYGPYVDAITKIIGTPGLATTAQPAEWTGYVYRMPHYLMRAVDRDAIPRGIYLFRRLPGDSSFVGGSDWSSEFEQDGELLAPLPTGW